MRNKKDTLGRNRGGPKALDRDLYGTLAPLTVRVDRRTRDTLKRLGEGSASAGIRLLALSYGELALADLVQFRADEQARAAAEDAHHLNRDGDHAGVD